MSNELINQSSSDDVQSLAKKFGDALMVATNSFITAGKMLVEAIDRFPETWEKTFKDLYPRLMKNQILVRRLELIGRGKLNPKVLSSDLTEGQKSFVEVLPMEMQNKFLDSEETIEVYNPFNDKPDRIPLRKLSSRNLKIVFDEETQEIRNLRDQKKAYELIETDRHRKPIIQDDGTIVFPKRTVVSPSEMEKLLKKAQMKKSEYLAKLRV